MEAYDFFLAELFLALGCAATDSTAGAFLLAAALAPLAARRVGAARFLGAVPAAAAPAPFAAPAAAVAAVALPFADFALAPGLPFVPLRPRPHLPKVRTGAAASRVRHSSKVRLFGSLSLGIFALR